MSVGFDYRAANSRLQPQERPRAELKRKILKQALKSFKVPVRQKAKRSGERSIEKIIKEMSEYLRVMKHYFV
jgi:hypothetical protein